MALQGLLERVREEVEDSCRRPVSWRLDRSCELDLHGDSDLLELLFLNLARNACAHCERERVEIGVRAEPGNPVAVDFSDNARGIPVSERVRVFDEYHRVAGSGPRGVGLGLAICRRIARRHGGDVRVVDSSPRGTTFRVTLPACP